MAQPKSPSRFRKEGRLKREGALPLPARLEGSRVDEGYERFSRLLDDGGRVALRRAAEALDGEVLAHCLERFDAERRERLLRGLGASLPPRTLAALDEDLLPQALAWLGAVQAARVISSLPSDDAVAVLEALTPAARAAIVKRLHGARRHFLTVGFDYPKDSAGRLMQREVVAIPAVWSVGRVVDYLRSEEGLPATFFDLQVVDPRQHPVGSVALSRVLRAQRHVSVRSLMDATVRPIPADMDQEEVAFVFRNQDLTSSPVVDKSGRLAGVITIDDVVDVIDDEAGEDLMRLGGVNSESFYSDLSAAMRGRLTWLVFNLAATFLAAFVIARFTDSIERLVALAVLMPVVASMGGMAAVQSLTVTVRALAMKELAHGNTWRTILREVSVNVASGVPLSALAACVSWLWFSDWRLSLIVFVAIVFNFTLAGLLGTLVPLFLHKMKLDPAVAAGPCVTVGTDIAGFFTFLGLATLYLL